MRTDPSAKRAPGRRRWRRRLLFCVAAALLAPVAGFAALDTLFPFPAERLHAVREAACSTVVLDRRGRPLRTFLSATDEWAVPIPLDRVSPFLIDATVAVEDERFRAHPGVDPVAIVRALASNARRGRVVSGASTITMQTVRLMAPRPRTLPTKAVEAFRALQLARLLSKDEVLEAYLNLAPYGGNLTGAEAASQAYFRKRAGDLTLAEAALLAGLPQSPSRLRPDRHPERAAVRRGHVLDRMVECGSITAEQADAARREPVAVGRAPLPFRAPHFARMVRGMVRRTRPGQGEVRTTLDADLQALAERCVARGVDGLRSSGVTNGAAVVIENATGAVRALVGSRDFADEAASGQVNGANARRSPGSALKPFVYALAFDQGHCAPSSVLADVPAGFAGYAPENYDRRHRGPVPAGEALRQSLNVPAVSLLRRCGQDRFYGLLQDLGISTLDRGPGHYGLALALGSSEVRLLELTDAYATLARLGVRVPWRMLESTPAGRPERLLSMGACRLVADVLSEGSGRDGRPRVAWKTGTSYGHRDAWTVAYTPDYTVGVWLGNFSGRPAAGLVGAEAAAPVAMGIMDAIHAGGPARWYGPSDAVGERAVCTTSGMPPGAHCEATGLAPYAPDVSSDRACSVHRSVRIDEETGAELCPHCAAGRAFAVCTVEVWPPGMAGWLSEHAPSGRSRPAHFAGCPLAGAGGGGPRIVSPAPGRTYVVMGEGGPGRDLPLLASAGAEQVHWFVDGALVGSGPPAEAVAWPMRRGRHEVRCVDSAGRAGAVAITVR